MSTKMFSIRNISKFRFPASYISYKYCTCPTTGAVAPPPPPPATATPPPPPPAPAQPKPALNCAIAGKNVLITGAANGIGLASAKTLVKLGANHVCMLDVDEKNGEAVSKALNEEAGRDCTTFQKVDVTAHEEFEEAFKKCVKKVRKLDIVFNNAGILNDHKWAECAAINMTGLIRGTMFAFKYMGLDQGACGGIVINCASILGLQPFAGCPVYVGTKHAIIGMTRSWGTPFWFDRTGVSVMAVCPGVTDTNMITATHGPDDPLTKELARGLDELPSQPAEKIGEAILTMVAKGATGSIWVSEGGEIYEVEVPARDTLKHK